MVDLNIVWTVVSMVGGGLMTFVTGILVRTTSLREAKRRKKTAEEFLQRVSAPQQGSIANAIFTQIQDKERSLGKRLEAIFGMGWDNPSPTLKQRWVLLRRTLTYAFKQEQEQQAGLRTDIENLQFYLIMNLVYHARQQLQYQVQAVPTITDVLDNGVAVQGAMDGDPNNKDNRLNLLSVANIEREALLDHLRRTPNQVFEVNFLVQATRSLWPTFCFQYLLVVLCIATIALAIGGVVYIVVSQDDGAPTSLSPSPVSPTDMPFFTPSPSTVIPGFDTPAVAPSPTPLLPVNTPTVTQSPSPLPVDRPTTAQTPISTPHMENPTTVPTSTTPNSTPIPFSATNCGLIGEVGWANTFTMSTDGGHVVMGQPNNPNGGTGSARGQVRVYNKGESGGTMFGEELLGDTAGDGFGWSVAMSSDGSRVAVGAPWALQDDSGLAHNFGIVKIFDKSETGWETVLLGYNTFDNADFDYTIDFGTAIALSPDGNRIAVSGDDYVKVFEWSASSSAWSQVGSDLSSTDICASFGHALAFNGTRLVVGAPHLDLCGQSASPVIVYDWTDSLGWTGVGNGIAASDDAEGGTFGYVVDMSSDGKRIAIGEPFYDSGNDGFVRVYEWSDTDNDWVKKNDIPGLVRSGDLIGEVDLSSDGNLLAIGGPGNDGAGVNAGHVNVYRWSGSDWQLVAEMAGQGAGDEFGWGVSLSDNGSFATFAGEEGIRSVVWDSQSC